MANSKAKLYYTKSQYLSTLPISNGNIIFVPDTRTVCLDFADERFYYHTIRVFETDADRLLMPFPNDGFYYVSSTNVLWRWDQEWKQVTPSALSPIYYGEKQTDFPEIGQIGVLYYTDEGVYRWNNQNQKYSLIANANIWDTIH